ncbi:hypothetical protein A2U01_0061199, partial [Trifolium medium]|nr:hypothetical protein [Trifolium medium]
MCFARWADGALRHDVEQVGDASADCAPRRKDGASRQQGQRKAGSFYQLRVAQERTARRASQLGLMH